MSKFAQCMKYMQKQCVMWHYIVLNSCLLLEIRLVTPIKTKEPFLSCVPVMLQHFHCTPEETRPAQQFQSGVHPCDVITATSLSDSQNVAASVKTAVEKNINKP